MTLNGPNNYMQRGFCRKMRHHLKTFMIRFFLKWRSTKYGMVYTSVISKRVPLGSLR